MQEAKGCQENQAGLPSNTWFIILINLFYFNFLLYFICIQLICFFYFAYSFSVQAMIFNLFCMALGTETEIQRVSEIDSARGREKQQEGARERERDVSHCS